MVNIVAAGSLGQHEIIAGGKHLGVGYVFEDNPFDIKGGAIHVGWSISTLPVDYSYTTQYGKSWSW
jgi:hypothetical protein